MKYFAPSKKGDIAYFEKNYILPLAKICLIAFQQN